MKTRITTLIENSQGEHRGLSAEHGISFLIEHDGFRILFDTGQTGRFAENARVLGLSLSDLDFVALSHGHYDHSGGVRTVATNRYTSTLITGCNFFDRKYATDGISLEYLGNDFDSDFLKSAGITHRIITKPIEELAPGVFALTAFPRIHEDEILNPRFMVERSGGMEIDDFRDELCLAVETSRGFVLILGCSHPGLKNMLDAARSLLSSPLYGIIGGTHLVEASAARLESSVRFLSESGIVAIGVSHCTGKPGTDSLEKSFNGFFRNVTGHSLFV